MHEVQIGPLIEDQREVLCTTCDWHWSTTDDWSLQMALVHGGGPVPELPGDAVAVSPSAFPVVGTSGPLPR